MSHNESNPLAERVQELEQLVDKLKTKITLLEGQLEQEKQSNASNPATTTTTATASSDLRKKGRQSTNGRSEKHSFKPSATPSPKPPPPPQPTRQHGRENRPMYALNSDEWLNRIGLILLFLGVGSLLNYIFTLEWFSPIYRVMSGSFVGLLLLAIGLHFHRIKPKFGQVLLGGGVASFFLTAFGAYQLYDLISYPLAFVVLFVITAFSFWLAAQRDDGLLAILATAGGLVTPFIMHIEGDRMLWLISYTSLVLIGSSAIYWFRGWRSLLFVSSVGAWLVVLFCYLNYGFQYDSISSERWTLQFGLLLALVLFWAMPVLRGILRSANSEKWPAPPPIRLVGYFFNHPALPLSITTPLTTLFVSILIWDLQDSNWGIITLVASLFFMALYYRIRLFDQNRGLNHLAQVQGFTAIILITIALFYLFDSYLLLVALAVEAFFIRLVARYNQDRLFSYTSHAFFLILTGWMVRRLINMPAAGPPMTSPTALSELLFIVLLGLTAVFVRRKWRVTVYITIAHFLFLGLMYREFNEIEAGSAVTSTVWGIYGIGLILYGLKREQRFIRYTGIFVMNLVALKLIFTDLEAVDPLIRILLFVSFGTIFIILSNLTANFFKKKTQDTPNVKLTSTPKEPEKVASEP